MDYEQALIIGKRRRIDAAFALTGYMRERAMEVCAVKPAKNEGLDAKDWDPVGEGSFKELCVRRSVTGDEEAYLVIVDETGSAKACTQKSYPLPIAVQLAWGVPLPVYAGKGGVLLGIAVEEAEKKAQRVVHLPEL